MGLGGGHRASAGVPIEAGNGTCRGRVILEAVLLRSHVAALVLSHLDLPLPGGGGGQSVDVNVDLITLSGGGDEHVSTSIVATDGRRNSSSRVRNGQSVVNTVSHSEGVRYH